MEEKGGGINGGIIPYTYVRVHVIDLSGKDGKERCTFQFATLLEE